MIEVIFADGAFASIGRAGGAALRVGGGAFLGGGDPFRPTDGCEGAAGRSVGGGYLGVFVPLSCDAALLGCGYKAAFGLGSGVFGGGGDLALFGDVGGGGLGI